MARMQRGFTLVELIMVIVILGILASLAIPRFASLGREARISAVSGLKGAVETGANLVFLQAVVAGKQSADRERVSMQGQIIEVKYGYPEAYGDNDGGLIEALEIDSSFEVCYGSSGCRNSNSSNIRIGFDLTSPDECYVRYIEPGGTGNSSATKYSVLVRTAGC